MHCCLVRRLYCQNTVSMNVTMFLRLSKRLKVFNYTPVRYIYYNGMSYKREHSALEILSDPKITKGFQFTLKERQKLGIHGLLPPVVRTMEDQMLAIKNVFDDFKLSLHKYVYLHSVREFSEILFFNFIDRHLEECIPILGPPTVDIVCKTFGLIYSRPVGLFITYYDKGHIFDILCNWPINFVKCICVTDGSKVSSGVGDIGALSMGIALSKINFYTCLGRIPSHYCLPVVLDVGTNNKDLLEDPLYVGIRRKRITASEYDEFMDEFIAAVNKRYSRETMIHFEDLGAINALKYLRKYQNTQCVISGDQQGVATAVLAAILATQKITHNQLQENIVMLVGTDEKIVGIANMIVQALQREGLRYVEAVSRIWIISKSGRLLTYETDIMPDVFEEIDPNAVAHTLLKAVIHIKPTILIGASQIHNLFTPEVIEAMYQNCAQPIIFPLSNPKERTECTADVAYKYTEGNCIFAKAAGSMIEGNIKERNVSVLSGNFFIPGVFLGVMASGSHKITRWLLYVAAHVVASHVTDEELEMGRVTPMDSRLPDINVEIASKVAAEVYRKGYATNYPEPHDMKEHLQKYLYSLEYHSVDFNTWKFKDTQYNKRSLVKRKF